MGFLEFADVLLDNWIWLAVVFAALMLIAFIYFMWTNVDVFMAWWTAGNHTLNIWGNITYTMPDACPICNCTG